MEDKFIKIGQEISIPTLYKQSHHSPMYGTQAGDSFFIPTIFNSNEDDHYCRVVAGQGVKEGSYRRATKREQLLIDGILKLDRMKDEELENFLHG